MTSKRPGTVVLSVKDLKRSFSVNKGSFWNPKRELLPALRGVTFDVHRGEIFGLLGPNGAGKTTTIDIIAGLLEKDSGTITYFGEPLSNAIKQRMNSTTAYAGLYDSLSVQQNLLVFCDLYEIDDPKTRIAQVCKLLSITEKLETRLQDLSAGQKTRVKLAKGLLNRPELLLLDEATIGLDPDIAADVRQAIKHLGTTILFTSHNMDEVAMLCDRIAFLSGGRIIASGTPQQLTKNIPHQELIIEYEQENVALAQLIRARGKAVLEHDTVAQRLRLRIDNDGRAMGRALEELSATHCGITNVQIEQPHLEDVFLRIAKEGR